MVISISYYLSCEKIKIQKIQNYIMVKILYIFLDFSGFIRYELCGLDKSSLYPDRRDACPRENGERLDRRDACPRENGERLSYGFVYIVEGVCNTPLLLFFKLEARNLQPATCIFNWAIGK
jgi:hypothetical protein